MALTKCPECGHDVATDAASCPHCGHPSATASAAAAGRSPVAQPVRRRSPLLFFLIVLGVLIVANALTKSDAPRTTASTTVDASTPVPEAPPSPEERRAGRQRFAKEYEKKMLLKNVDMTVRAIGPEARTLKMTYILAGRPLAYQISQDREIMANLQSLGFRRVIVSDGHDESYSVKIVPLPGDEEAAAQRPAGRAEEARWVGDKRTWLLYHATPQCNDAKLIVEGDRVVFPDQGKALVSGYHRSETKGC